MRLFFLFSFPSILLAARNVVNNIALPCALTGKMRFFNEITFPFRLSVCTEGTLFYFNNGGATVFYLNYNGTYSTKSVKCICPRTEKFVAPIENKFLLINRFGHYVRVEWADFTQTTVRSADYTAVSTSTVLTSTSTSFNFSEYIKKQTIDFLQTCGLGILGILTTLVGGLMLYFRQQVKALLIKINQQSNVTTNSNGTNDEAELTARLLALRQLSTGPTFIHQQEPQPTSTSKANTALPPSLPHHSASATTTLMAGPVTNSSQTVNEKETELKCTVRQFDMKVGCGKTCRSTAGLKKHETACIKHVNDAKKIAEEAKRKKKRSIKSVYYSIVE